MSVIEAMATAYENARTATYDCDESMRAAAAAEREGWRLAPVEPTEEMLRAGQCDACAPVKGYGSLPAYTPLRTVWETMLAASPEVK